MPLLLRVLLIVLAIGLTGGAPARAEQAVLFVTDWSNSMTGRAQDGRQLFRLTPAVIQSFFASSAVTGQSPTVGLITFGDIGTWSSRADEARCEEDVTLRVDAGTNFATARSVISGELTRTKPSGFTPIYTAIDIATLHAIELIRQDKATSVRIVVITDLKDTCDAENGYRPLQDYCALGERLAERVKQGKEESQGLVKLEFVVALGSNIDNLSVLAECAGAKPLPAQTEKEAKDAGDEIANTPPPDNVYVTVVPVFTGGADTLGRGVDPAGATVMILPEGAQTPERQPVAEQVSRQPGTVAKLGVEVPAGVSDGPVDIVFDRSQTVEIAWRLPRVTVEVRGSSGQGEDRDATVILRQAAAAGEAFLPVPGTATFPLLPGDYEAIVGFSSGNWEKRAFHVERRVDTQTLVFSPGPAAASALWTATPDDDAGLPSALTATVQPNQSAATPLPFRRETAIGSRSGPDSVALELRRGATPVWSGTFEANGAGWRLTARGGLVWVTANADRPGVWRLINRSDVAVQPLEFFGDAFARPVPPSSYMLFFEDEPVCPEGESFAVRIGQPVDLGTSSAWSRGPCE